MLVLAHVSSMKTTLDGSINSCEARHAARCSTTSGRSCSLAISVFFFETDRAHHMRHRSSPGKPLRPAHALIRLATRADKCRAEQRSSQQASRPKHATWADAEPPFLARSGRSRDVAAGCAATKIPKL